MNTLLVFDIDGTLTDSVEIHRKGFIKALNHFGVDTSKPAFAEFEHHTDFHIAKVLLEDIGIPWTNELVPQFEKILMDTFLQHPLELIPGTLDLFDQIQASENLFTTYATGSFLAPAKHKLEPLNIPEKLISSSNDLETREEIVLHSIELAKTHYNIDQFDQFYAFGDGKWDMQTAENLDIPFIGVGTENKETLLQGKHLLHVDDFKTFDLSNLKQLK